MKKIAIDMDGVMAQTALRAAEWYKRDFGIEVDFEAIKGKMIFNTVLPAHREKVMTYPYQKGYFRDLPVMPHAKEVIPALSEKYELFVTTAATQFPLSFNEKYEWLAEHFPNFDWQHIVFCGSKTIIKADYMIDDHTYNLDGFEGEGLLFTQYHNCYKEGYKRVNNWLEVGEFFLG